MVVDQLGASLSEMLGSLAEGLAARIVLAVIVVGAGVAAGIVVRRTVARFSERLFPRDVSTLLSRGSYYAVLAGAVIIAAQVLGLNLTALAVAGGVAGIVLSFALQPLLSNFFSGLYLYGEKSLIPGDMVEIGGVVGRVMEVTTMSTRVRTLDGVVVRIPNSKIIGEYVVNYSQSAARRLTFEASIAYREDLSRAVETIRKAVSGIYLVLDDPPPEVYASNLGDSGVIITVRVWVPTNHWYQAYMQVMGVVREALAREGIEIPFNQVDVWFRTPLVVSGGAEVRG